MPTTQVQTPPAATAELVPLAQLATWLRLDLDTDLLAAVVGGTDLTGFDLQRVADLQNVADDGRAARELVELFTGRFYAPQTITITYRLDEPYVLPAGATAVSVSGYFNDLADLDTIPAYLVGYQKGISIERQYPLEWALAQTYTVVANTTGDAVGLNLAKSAVKELVAEWYKNRETSVDSRVGTLPVSWQVKLAPVRVNPLGFAD